MLMTLTETSEVRMKQSDLPEVSKLNIPIYVVTGADSVPAIWEDVMTMTFALMRVQEESIHMNGFLTFGG